MKAKSWIVICLSMSLLLMFSAPVLAQGVIKIGAVYPLSGNIASTGLDCKRGVDLAVDIINGKYGKILICPWRNTEAFPIWEEPNWKLSMPIPRETRRTACPRPKG